MRDPVSMQCGHSGCKDCLEKIRSSPLEYRHCPICREQHNFNTTTFTVNVSLQQLIFALKVKCGEPSCEWQGTLEAGKRHKDNCCFVFRSWSLFASVSERPLPVTMSSATHITPCRPFRVSVSLRWKISLLIFKPKGSLDHRYLPKGVIIVVSRLDSLSSFTCQ